MNERILELRTQAAAWVAENHQPQDPNAYSQKEIDQRYLMYEEKFAELIVFDAIAKIESVGFKSSNDIPFEITDLFVSQIKKHFGVK